MAIDPRLYDSLAKFRHSLRRFLDASEALSGAAGVTVQQYQALLIVMTHGPAGVTIKELAGLMLMQHHGVVRLANHLVRAGLVTRRPVDGDGRSVAVAMTEAGEALIEELSLNHLQELLRHEQLLAELLRHLRELERPRKVRLD